MIVLAGADLFTSSTMFMTTAFVHRRIAFKDILTSWVLSYLGTSAGMLSFMAIITEYGECPNRYHSVQTETINLAVQKGQLPGRHQISFEQSAQNGFFV